jgi:hypothetical protein
MHRGYVLIIAGVLLGLAAYAFLPPSFIGINGHQIDTHVLAAFLSVVLMVLGIVLLLIRMLTSRW